MSATLIDGGPAGPDEAGGTYRNRILTDRAAWWKAMGGRQGVIRGFDLATLGGQMALTVEPGLGMVEERNASGNTGQTDRGYAVWADVQQTVTFGAASASDRNDAVVLAFVDVAVGAAAVGTETSTVGGQIVVVPGVSGTTTPRTDSDISAAVGSGGWVRLADVVIESTDTEVQAVNITNQIPRNSTSAFASVYSASGGARGANTEAHIGWDGTTELTGGAAFPDNNREMHLVPGLYEVHVKIGASGATGGTTFATLRRNSAGDPAGGDAVARDHSPNQGGTFITVQFSKTIRVTSYDDHYQVFVGTSASATGTMNFRSGEFETFWTARRVPE